MDACTVVHMGQASEKPYRPLITDASLVERLRVQAAKERLSPLDLLVKILSDSLPILYPEDVR